MTPEQNTLAASIAADIARRRILVPFEDGPSAAGLLIGTWRPRKDFKGDLAPTHVKQATLYHVTDGRPGAYRLSPFPCMDPSSLDMPALLARCRSGTVRPHSIPPRRYDIRRWGDPFLDMAWGCDLDAGALFGPILEGILSAEPYVSSNRVRRAARTMALEAMTRDVREAARTHFVERLSDDAREVMERMRETLPFFGWAAFAALSDDPDGKAWRFARAYPLLAGRALASEAVRSAVAAGDMDAARDAAMDASVVGSWTVETLGVHPDLAAVVDGRRRGHATDRAVERLSKVVRDHVPVTPEDFAACADACEWAEAVEGDYTGPRAAGKLIDRMKGHWAKASEACLSAAVLDGRHLSPESVKELFLDMATSFRSDIVDPALDLLGDAEGPRTQYSVRRSNYRHSQAGLLMAYKGMSAPDRIRHAVRYALARPAIAAVDGLRPDDWSGKVILPGDGPWIDVGRGFEARALAFGSSASLRNWSRGRTDEDDLGWLWLPALAPDGFVCLAYESRRPDGGRVKPPRHYGSFESLHAKVQEAMAASMGATDPQRLGDWLLERHGLAERVGEKARSAVSVRRERFAAMLRAWGPALPRRFRRLEPDAAIAAIAEEHAATAGRSSEPMAA